MNIANHSLLAVMVLSLTLYGCGKNEEQSRKTKEFLWVEKGKDAVKEKLKDSNSVEFRNVYFHRGADNIPMTCGEVNSKNSLGGYTGYQKFVSAGRPDLTFLQEQVADFGTTWNKFCQ